MVPDLPSPSLTRRRLVAAAGGLLATGTVGVGATAPTALPDPLADEAVNHYPTPPEVTAHWRPTVTEAHASEVVETLAETVERAEGLWADLDTDRPYTGAGGWLEDARTSLSNGDYHDALFEATYGLQFAANDLGVARARLHETDLPALADRALAVRDRARSVLDAVDPYPVDDPGVDLAWYLRVEQEAVQAANQAVWPDVEATANGFGDDDGPPRGRFDPGRVGDLTEGVVLAEVAALNAEHFFAHLQNRVGDDATHYADHLAAVADEFRPVLESRPSREAVLERHDVRDADDYGPYEFAHGRLARWCYESTLSPWAVEVDADVRVLTAVAYAQGVVNHRAHGFATDHLVVEEDDTGFDPGRVLAEKRRARDAYREAFGDDPDPLLTRQAARAVEDLQVADVDLGDTDDDWPAWKERLDAYLYALVGRARFRHHPDVYATLVDGP
jgi:hypothetical protein